MRPPGNARARRIAQAGVAGAGLLPEPEAQEDPGRHVDRKEDQVAPDVGPRKHDDVGTHDRRERPAGPDGRHGTAQIKVEVTQARGQPPEEVEQHEGQVTHRGLDVVGKNVHVEHVAQ